MLDADGLDIVGADRKDPVDVVEYVDDLYAFYKDVEVYRLLRNIGTLPMLLEFNIFSLA